jgi:N-formylglutamate amidohydrolase
MRIKNWKLIRGEGPLVATAIHNGHQVREELLNKMSILETDRLREEDPFTENWTQVANTRVVGLRSRFEVDLNRPRERAIYMKPEDAWNLKVWNKDLSDRDVEISLSAYDAFYAEMYQLLSDLKNQYGHFVVFDFHSYNHMRNGPEGPPAHPDANPEINVGTGTLDRSYWAPVVERFMDILLNFDYFGRKLDVRENVRFRGGNFPFWIHQHFPRSGCALAIEVKKIFMNEWTGKPDHDRINTITRALQSTVPGILDVLKSF